MKKVLLIAAFAVFGLGVSNAQEFKIGVNGALPMGTFGDAWGFGAGLDVSYLWEVGDGFYAGGATGYHHFFGKSEDFDTGFGTVTIDWPDFQIVPVTASARYLITEEFFAGADIGYAVGVGNAAGSAFYYRPKAGYSFGSVGAVVSYTGMSGVSYITFGVEFGL